MIMNELLGKITSYNLFNYLLPGVLFVVMLDKFTDFSFTQENIVIGAFVYYFAGLIISRFGSLILEPILKKLSFIKFAEHQDFVFSSKQDPKVETLLEASNMYRTFAAMFLLLLLFKLYNFLSVKFPILNESSIYILIALLLVMFLFSYRKQTEYISKRVKVNNQ